jgi:hypothetical protein
MVRDMDFIKDNSYLYDSLELFLRDKYYVSDNDIRLLSDILLRRDLGSVAEKGYLFNLIYVMDMSGVSFPVTYAYLKERWEASNISYSFNTILSKFIEAKLLSLKRVTETTLFETSIVKSESDVAGQDYYIVLYSTQNYKDLRSELTQNNLLTNPSASVDLSMPQTESVQEGYGLSSMSGDIQRFVGLFRNEVADTGYQVDVESFSEDVLLKEYEINFTVKVGTNLEDIKPTDAVRVCRKNIKETFVKNIDCYKDGDGIIFLSLKMSSDIIMSDLYKLAVSCGRAVDGLMGITA